MKLQPKPCRKCGSTAVLVRDCGYSSFNVGSVTCECGNEVNSGCSTDDAHNDLVRAWNADCGDANELKQALAALVRMYVANRWSANSTFISCITPSHASEMTATERKNCRTWKAWDDARRALGEFVQFSTENKGKRRAN